MYDFLPISFQTQILLKLHITQNKRALFGTFEQRYWRTSLKKKKKEKKTAFDNTVAYKSFHTHLWYLLSRCGTVAVVKIYEWMRTVMFYSTV